MSTTNTSVSGSVTTEGIITKSYSTSTLAQLFANYLLGSGSKELLAQKYFQVYKLTPDELVSRYEQNKALPHDNLILEAGVRTSHLSTSFVDDNTVGYYSTFIATIDGSEITIPEVSSTDPLSIGLLVGKTLLIATSTFDYTVYQK